VVITINSQQKYHKIISQASRSHGIELEQRLCEKLHKTPKMCKSRTTKISTYILFISTCKNVTN